MIKLQYPKLPRNSYSYKASIFGIPIRDALIFSIIASISILSVRINIYTPILGTASIVIILLFRRRLFSGLKITKKIRLKGRKINIFFPVKVQSHNEHLFTLFGKSISIFLEVEGINIMAIRVNDQKTILEGLRHALEVSEMNIDFFSCYQRHSGSRNGIYSFKTYVRIFSGITVSDLELSMGELEKRVSNFESSLGINGFHARELRKKEEIEDLLKILIP